MKTIKKSLLVAVLITLGFALPSKAQLVPQGYFNVDWQLNVPISNDFASKTSGWGMNFEGGYYLPNTDFAIGAFLAFHTNNEYIGRETIVLGPQSAVTTDQQHSVFQLPFGVLGRYKLTDGMGVLDPYVSLKLGPAFSRISSFYSVYESYDEQWGFYFSPEIGTTIWPGAMKYVGIHVAAYFSYSTNKSELLKYSVDGLSNFGVRVGLTF